MVDICPIFQEHQFNYDPESSDISKSVFRCLCGADITEHEDCGTGV